MLYVAKKYILPSLADKCIEFLQGNLDAGNVFCVLSHAQRYDEKNLEDQCWEVIERETEEAVKSEGFETIDRSLLEEIVKRDSLTIREVELFKAVDLWATKECERQGMTVDGNVKRKILGEKIVKEIRFPVMEVKEFARVVPGCKILTSEEVIDIMKHLNSVESSLVSFPVNERVRAIQSCCRFSNVVSSHKECCVEWDYTHNKRECLDIRVDQDIKLHGIRMFGSVNSDYVVILKISDTHSDNKVVAHKSGTFSSPVVLSRGIKYCVSAIIDGPGSGYGFDGTQVADCCGVKFSFFQCQKKDCGETDVQYGQFAAFLFRPK